MSLVSFLAHKKIHVTKNIVAGDLDPLDLPCFKLKLKMNPEVKCKSFTGIFASGSLIVFHTDISIMVFINHITFLKLTFDDNLVIQL